MKRVRAVWAMAWIATCAGYAETTEVATEKDGTLTVASNSRLGESTPVEEMQKAVKVAFAYCQARGLQMHILSTKAKSSGVNRVASSRIYFECVSRPAQ